MDNSFEHRLLIISNNVLSERNNNGKTIYSYIDRLPRASVAQLYFSTEKPEIDGYQYFQLSDTDVVKGALKQENRGRCIAAVEKGSTNVTVSGNVSVKNNFTRYLREVVWYNRWKSKQLLTWLDVFCPTAVLFVGGDCAFAYDICRFIVNRYNARLSLYITDDYVMPRRKEDLFGKIRRRLIRKQIKATLTNTSCFYTVSAPMQKAYKELFGVESKAIVNLTESLKLDDKGTVCQEKQLDMIYAGSLYYGRDAVLGKIAQAIEKYNNGSTGVKARLKIFTNTEPSTAAKAIFTIKDCCEYCGSLSKRELIEELNRSEILVFVESFDENQIEKTRYSLSTKVPEYMSVGKPILAVGPKGIGSMDYLEDVALCINALDEMDEKVELLLQSSEVREQYGEQSYDKYVRLHNKEKLQKNFLKNVLGAHEE